VIDRQQTAAGLLNAPGDAEAVKRTERVKRLEDHQSQRALPDVAFLFHIGFPYQGGTASMG
jgi:hypothetical protein